MSRYGRGSSSESKLYVGDLPRDASEKEIERAFSYYGPLRSVWVARNPPGFAFVEYEDPRDADDAMRSLDGSDVCGSRVRVERSNGKVRRGGGGGRGGGYGGGGGGYGGGGGRGPPRGGGRKPFDTNDRCYECGERGHYAYNCEKQKGGGGGGRSRRRSKSYERSSRRSYSRSRSRSKSRSRSPVSRADK